MKKTESKAGREEGMEENIKKVKETEEVRS